MTEDLFNHHDLMQAVLAPDNLRRAWKRVKSNKGAPGIDRISIDDFTAHAKALWPDIRRHLEAGDYPPAAVRRVTIPKAGGGERLLGIPTVTDRVIQQAIAQVLTPIFDPQFSASSFGFRPGRNAHQAVRQVQAYIEAGYRIAVDIDLAKFFDTVNHDVLMRLLGRRIRDKSLLALIGRYLRAGVLVGEHVHPSDIGTPQGWARTQTVHVDCLCLAKGRACGPTRPARGPLSPLLANILLHQLDCELERRGHRFARYADDLIILVKSQRAGERVKRSLTRYLEHTLKLTVNEAKSKVAPVSECAFLSLTFRGKKLRWTDAALEDFKHRVRKLTGRSWGCSGEFRRHVACPRNGTGMQASARPARVSMDYRMLKLGQYVRGWMGYFGVSQYYRPIPELDDWLRRRLRMCYWKQWRWCRTKIRHLRELGVNLKMAIRHAVSSKSYWHMARTPALQMAMSNAWLKAQGLVSVRDLWMKAQGYAV